MASPLDQVDGDEIMSAINVTPLVDVAFVMLAIFMVTTTIITAPSIEIELPQAATASDTEPSVLGLTLSRDGILYLNEEETTEEAVRAFIRTDTEEKGEPPQAIIAADAEVPFGRVVFLIDLVKQEGVSSFALNVDPTVAQTYAEGLPPAAPPTEAVPPTENTDG